MASWIVRSPIHTWVSTGSLELTETLGQERRRDQRHATLDVTESSAAQQQLANNQRHHRSHKIWTSHFIRRGGTCEGCPSITDLQARYVAAGGSYLVCPICFNAKHLDPATLIDGATIGGTVPMWEWIGDGATTFSY